MKRGFTILELLVASILLGMMMTILTMIFSQSSVAWRLGGDCVLNLNEYRSEKGYYNDRSDVTFVHNGTKLCEHLSPFEDGTGGGKTCDLRTDRAVREGGESVFQTAVEDGWGQRSASSVNANAQSVTYTVNVMSGGPNNDVMDWKAIWSYPDDFD